MKNLLQTQSIAWARGVQIALEAEGIRSKVLGEFDRGFGLMPWMPVRVVIFDDDDLERARTIVARLAPRRTGPPPSWRWQKRGLLLCGLGIVLLGVWSARFHMYHDEQEGSLVVVYVLGALVVFVFITGFLFIALGPRADRAKGNS